MWHESSLLRDIISNLLELLLNHFKSKVYLINNKEYLTESISSLLGHIKVGYSHKQAENWTLEV